MANRSIALGSLALALMATGGSLQGQQGQVEGTDDKNVIDMTLETMTQLALSNSYEVRFLDLNIEQTSHQLRAERARLRSSVQLDIAAPVWEDISQEHFNTELGRNEFFRENELRYEGELSIRQPVIIPFLGYPTNGYLSLNNRVYRLAQRDDDGSRDVEYYNRYFIRYTQPLFQPNDLRNDLEEAELDLENEEIDFYDNMFDLIDEVSDDYFRLFETAYETEVGAAYVANLENAVAAAEVVVQANANRSIELDQIRVELANAQEELRQSETNFRRQTADIRTEMNLDPEEVIALDPVIEMRPFEIDADQAIEYATLLAPRLRRLRIQERRREINLDQVRGRNAFQVDLEFTYGREMRDPFFNNILRDPENTYTIDVNARIPIWDWGERDARIEASEINLRRSALQMEEAQSEIISDVQNEIQDVEELQARALTMQDNLDLARQITQQGLEGYRDGTLTALDLLQTLQREIETAENLLEAYVGWQRSVRQLQELTYYDFELDVPVMERYGVDVSSVPGFIRD